MATVASGVVVVTVVPGAETVLAEGTLLLEGGVSAGSRVKIAFRLKGCTPHFETSHDIRWCQRSHPRNREHLE